ncbi:putative glucan endo-1,3-beta-D-glucosidase [Dioscorea sansibarensis]
MARRVEALSSFPVLSVALILLAFTLGGTVKLVQGQKTWCVAKPSLDDATLLLNINYACSQVDCSVLRKGSPCFNPDNLISHASVAMNLYYQSKGRNPWNCNFKNTALVVTTDPSFGSCAYAWQASR